MNIIDNPINAEVHENIIAVALVPYIGRKWIFASILDSNAINAIVAGIIVLFAPLNTDARTKNIVANKVPPSMRGSKLAESINLSPKKKVIKNSGISAIMITVGISTANKNKMTFFKRERTFVKSFFLVKSDIVGNSINVSANIR